MMRHRSRYIACSFHMRHGKCLSPATIEVEIDKTWQPRCAIHTLYEDGYFWTIMDAESGEAIFHSKEERWETFSLAWFNTHKVPVYIRDNATGAEVVRYTGEEEGK